MKKQNGIVLFFAIIVLLLLTIIGVSLAVNSSMSIQMSGAGSEKIEALLTAQGKLKDGVTAIREGRAVGGDVNVRIARLPCPRLASANSDDQGAVVNNFVCREIGVTETYGKNNLGQLTVVFGVKNIIDDAQGN
ncbi:pilus assembly protein PilX [Shewanella sp. 202IG2-18]|uniref:PilX N-terminal domain-containing pilus assembly protein n=1 Tax=Parashewanella hymeniacidonis TaxID=2807618 RepID=UPI00196171D7|nr:PilX N-terminal domain-containing pilus assembly protein [Parashewanella hymeniacidonis]MBM7071564.1 pilus assembly protein PilX [Parashewanella hymeniacidonis]